MAAHLDIKRDYTINQQANPLYNDLVLGSVFQYFSVAELKNVRRVCRLYNEIAKPFLQENSIVKLNENIHLVQGVSLDKFLEDFQSVLPTEVFFRNYKLSLWNIDTETPRVLRFWEKYGMSIRSLEVSWARFIGIPVVKNVFFNWTPNMKLIIIRDCSFYSLKVNEPMRSIPLLHVVEQAEDTDPNVRVNYNLSSLELYGEELHNHPPIKWEEIFIAYPNLKQLLMYNLTPNQNMVILEAIEDIRKKDPHNMTLEKLNVFNGDSAASDIPTNVLTCLIDLKLPLTQLDIDIGAHCNEYLIAKLLEQHSKTLRKLTIYRGPKGFPMCKFPFEIIFPKLNRLEMTETVADNFNFVQFTPNLTSLSICEPPEVEPPFLPTDMIFKSDYDFPRKTLPLHLRNLRIDYDCSYGDVRKLVHWFPTMKTVKMYFDNESLRTICGEWPDLEELEVLGDKVNDEGITGMKLKRENGQEIVIRNPLCIHNLKRLRTFTMKNYGMSTVLSDLSVHHGFLKMKSLSYLELCSRNITEVGWKALFNMSYLTTLIPTDGRWQSNCEAFRKGS